METNDLKYIWKRNIEKQIQSFSKDELDNMLLLRAKKKINKFYSIKTNVLILVIVILFLAIITVKHPDDILLIINNLFLIISAMTGLGLNLYSYNKIMNYNVVQPLKDWLQYRIEAFIKASKRLYAYYITFPPFLILANIATSSFFENLSFTEVVSSLAFPVKCLTHIVAGIIAAYFLKKYMQKQYSKTITNLQKLYKEISENESGLP
ncbi:MAG: hypothetical protein LBV43_09545 [Prevotella sp.]|jgi:hypothetical protein|nr:hypothetical protein [Prevotella sp.]